jgi:hypothetical protein
MGAGRSGSKFLMNILNNSDLVHLAPEIHYFSSLIHNGFRKNLRRAYGVKTEYRIDEVIECLRRRDNFGTYWRRENEFNDQEIKTWFYDKRIDDKNIYEYIIQHDRKHYAPSKTHIKYIGEKALTSIFHLGKILKWYSDATILFIYRNPINVLKSEVNKGLKPDYPLSKSNPLYAYGLIIYVFAYWLLAAIIALFYRARYRNNVVFVSYDYMTHNIEDVVQRITTVIDIPYRSEMCLVEKVDSSLSDNTSNAAWTPPKWVVWLYKMTLSPLMTKLDRQAVHREVINIPASR